MWHRIGSTQALTLILHIIPILHTLQLQIKSVSQKRFIHFSFISIFLRKVFVLPIFSILWFVLFSLYFLKLQFWPSLQFAVSCFNIFALKSPLSTIFYWSSYECASNVCAMCARFFSHTCLRASRAIFRSCILCLSLWLTFSLSSSLDLGLSGRPLWSRFCAIPNNKGKKKVKYFVFTI